jgi:hypothetical protein
LFGWFGDEQHVLEEGGKWVWSDSIQPLNSQDFDHRKNIGTVEPICKAFTVLEMMGFFGEGRNGEILNEAIQTKLNQGKQLFTFIADPEFYAQIIFRTLCREN